MTKITFPFSSTPLIVIQWHLTAVCDQRCKFCYMFDSPTYKSEIENELSYENCIKIIDDFCSTLQRWGIPGGFHLTGGDPLLRKNFFKILEYIHNKKEIKRITILGNPSHLTAAVIKDLKRLGVQGYQISVDGMEKMHDNFRSPGSFQKSLKALRKLKEGGIVTRMMFTLSRKNAKDLLEIIRLAAREKVDIFSFDRMVPIGAGKKLKEEVLTTDEFHNLLIRVSDEYRRLKAQGATTYFSKKVLLFILLYEDVNLIDRFLESAGPLSRGCSIGRGLCLLADGTALPCRRLPVKVGKLPEQSFQDVFINSKILNRMRGFSNYKKCARCNLVKFCRGCPAFTYALTGDYFAPDPNCWKEI